MATLERPRLRWLRHCRVEHQGGAFGAFQDPLGVADPRLLVSLDLIPPLIRHCNGSNSLEVLQDRFRLESGSCIALEEVRALIAQLDRAMVLDGPTFAAFKAAYARETVRPAAFAGRTYPSEKGALSAMLGSYFGPSAPEGRGRPVRGILSPHIDFSRGGRTYAQAYGALAGQTDAEVFVVLGVAHQGPSHRFVLTRKDFETPLGTARTARGYVDAIAEQAGGGYFEDELTHRTEHSIEFQVAFLQHVLGERRPFEIVPILVGSFHDLMERGIDPIQDREVHRFVEALRAAERTAGKRVAYIGGVDFGHIGREFGDPDLLSSRVLGALRDYDTLLLKHASVGDARSWFREATAVQDRWRTCGLAATYTFLHAMGPSEGRLLGYDQAVNPERTCCVSFASMAFHALEQSAPHVAPHTAS